MASAGRVRVRGVVAGLLAIAIVVAAVRLAPPHRVLALVAWARAAGAAGALAYGLAFAAGVALGVPATLLQLGAGFLYGPVAGTLLSAPANALGASAAFLLGRTVARPLVARRIARDPRLARIDAAVEARGFRFVLLLRLFPGAPWGVLNYAVALTRIPLGTFAAASLLGTLPTAALFSALGALATSAAELGVGPDAARALRIAGGLALVFVLVLFVLARRGLRAALRRTPPGPPPGV